MILAPDGLVRYPFLVQKFAKFRVNARVIAAPKGAKGIFGGFRLPTRLGWAARRRGRLIHQSHVAIGAPRKPLPILRFALWTIHVCQAQALSAPKVTLFSALARGTFQSSSD